MDVMEAIAERRSIRAFSSKPVEEEKLTAVLEAARLAPSSNNSQEWKFIAVRDRETIARLTQACGGQAFVGTAPVVIAACATYDHDMTCGQPADTVNTSIALSFAMLEAVEQGLGTCWLGFFYADRVKEILGIPDGVSVVAVTPLGYPAQTPAARPRKEAAQVISYEKF